MQKLTIAVLVVSLIVGSSFGAFISVFALGWKAMKEKADEIERSFN